MKLYGPRVSPFVARIEILLDLKGKTDALDRPDMPGQPSSAAYRAINPIGKVPALVTDNGTLVESRAILAYLDRLFPDPRLMPSDPFDAGRVEMLMGLADHYLVPHLPVLFRNAQSGTREGKDLDQAKAGLGEALDHINHFLTDSRHLAGEGWSLADCVAIPVFFYLKHLGPMFGFDPLAGRTKLLAWDAAIMATDEGARATQEQAAAVAAFTAERAQAGQA